MQEELKSRGLTVLLVNLWEKPSRVAKTVQERKYTARVLLDPDGKVSKAYRVAATPTVFLIGRDGTLLGHAVGPKPWAEPTGRALIEALLKQPGPRAQADTR
jgi:peroxiredoxin